MLDEIKSDLNVSMAKSIESLKNQLTRVRTGRASASILDGVSVDYYGSPTPVAQVGQVSTPEARLLQIQPFDKTMITEIEKAILGANLGLTPQMMETLFEFHFRHLQRKGEKSKFER